MDAGSFRSLEERLGDPGLCLDDVLLDPVFFQGVRMESEIIASYLIQPQNFRRILGFALNLSYATEKRYEILSPLCAKLLSTKYRNFTSSIVEDPGVSTFLLRFFDTKSIESPRLCGHFARIVFCFLSFTRGDMPDLLNELPYRVIEHIRISSMKILFSQLLTDFNSSLADKSQLCDSIIAELVSTPDNSLHMVRALSQSVGDRRCVLPIGGCLDIFSTLLDIASHPKSTFLLRTESLKLSVHMKSLYPSNAYPSILKDKHSQFNFENLDASFSFLCQLYPKEGLRHVSCLFSDQTNNLTMNSVLKLFRDADAEDQHAITKDLMLPPLILDFCKVPHLTGHATEVTTVIKSYEDLTLGDREEEWKTYISTVYAEKYELISSCKKQQAQVIDDTPVESTWFDFSEQKGGFDFTVYSSDSEEEEANVEELLNNTPKPETSTKLVF